MLVLSRKVNEKIIVSPPGGPRIELVVVRLQGDKVRIGIDAPLDVSVHRGEVQRAIECRAERRAKADAAFEAGMFDPGDQDEAAA